MKRSRNILYIFLALIMLFSITACTGDENGASSGGSDENASDTTVIAQQLVENLPLVVDGESPKTIRTIHYSYKNNRYLSIRDMASALSGTSKQFDLAISDGATSITTNKKYSPVGGENDPFPEPVPENFTYETGDLDTNPLSLDGRDLIYYSFLGINSNDEEDCFLNLTDLAMQLDLSMKISDGKLVLDTGRHYSIDIKALEKQYFYYDLHSAVVGDADTGEIYTSWEPDLSVPIASTTKLMTYLVLKDLIAKGIISSEDIVTIPKEAALLSRSPDGEIKLNTGEKLPFDELLHGMLLPSSNECALSLAIHAAGSEDVFVELMRKKAKELGLSEKVVFFNCHGLPVYTDNLATTKVQNRMTAKDMFLIVRHIMKKYPEITKITSEKSANLKTMDITVKNTNPLLWNLPGVVGLKTGTTDMAGDCLVVLMEAKDPGGKPHDLVAIQFGAEDETVRVSLTEELIRYARQQLLAK